MIASQPCNSTASDATAAFIGANCLDCHDQEPSGGLDLSVLRFTLQDRATFDTWVKVFDRVQAGEMPPKSPPPKADRDAFLSELHGALTAAERERQTLEGRAARRRLNRHEYEDTLRDLLAMPNLQVKDYLPEDGELHRFNKISGALDVSHVNMARYMSAANYALRQALAPQAERPATQSERHYTRDKPKLQQQSFREYADGRLPFNTLFPVLDSKAQPDVRAGKAPVTAGDADPDQRNREAVGVLVSRTAPVEVRFGNYVTKMAGRYRLRFSAYSIWTGIKPNHPKRWPDRDNVSRGRRSEPVTIYADVRPSNLRKLASFDVGPDPTVHEFEAWLPESATIRPDAARFFRGSQYNPLAEADGIPGVAFQWMDVEGPLLEQWPPASHQVLFGALPLVTNGAGKTFVVSDNPERDAAALLKNFLARAYRRPVDPADETRFLTVIKDALQAGYHFTDAMLTGYSAVLCSPRFLYLDEAPGRLDDWALASRLSYFFWNAAPDGELRGLAAAGKLQEPDVLRAQTDRLLNDPRARRFVDAFLDYWLDLRNIGANTPDDMLYPDYLFDDLLEESMLAETQLFFSALIARNLGARNLVASDFAIINERLAKHYGIPGVDGVALRRVTLPPDSVRGGLLTQGSVLRVTANGTTTSPVIRGVWIMERILGLPPPPPPPGIPAVEPDTRGATTIREQLALHRAAKSCADCHKKFDPAGMALENFDTMGAWRDRYRVLGDGEKVPGVGRNGNLFEFTHGPQVDASGELHDGRKFNDIRELKALLLKNEEQLARNLVQQLAIYATGAEPQFSDRPLVNDILAASKGGGFGVRTLIHELVQSRLFRHK